jgi:hypothetical protein
MESDLSKLSEAEAKSLLSERLRALLEHSPDKTKIYSERLLTHYRKLNVFPKSLGTLDASIRALVGIWDKEGRPQHP